jgi:hypothetical protein
MYLGVGVFGMVDADADRKKRERHEQTAEDNSPRIGFRDENGDYLRRSSVEAARLRAEAHRLSRQPFTSAEEAPEVTPPPAKARMIMETAGEAPLTSAVGMPVVKGYPAATKTPAATALPAKTAPPPAETPTEEANAEAESSAGASVEEAKDAGPEVDVNMF